MLKIILMFFVTISFCNEKRKTVAVNEFIIQTIGGKKMCDKEELMIEASDRISKKDDIAIEVAENLGQDFEEVQNNNWFVEAVAKHIAINEDEWNHLNNSF